MEVENKDVYLEFDVIADVEDNLADEIIAKGLYLNDSLENDNLSVVDDLVTSIMELIKGKEDE